MDISETYIKMCDHPFIQGTIGNQKREMFISARSQGSFQFMREHVQIILTVMRCGFLAKRIYS